MMRRVQLRVDPTDVIALAGLVTTALGVGLVAGLGAALIVIGLAAIAYAIAVAMSTPTQNGG